jgi:hypothetical protein
MAHDLSPHAVAERLNALRQAWVPEDEASVRARMTHQPPRAASFEEAVAVRLHELRALLELTTYLHRAHCKRR